MGYSCTARASEVLDKIMSYDKFNIDHEKYSYFIEIGKENFDGAITGTVYRLIGESFVREDGLKSRRCKKAGSFRIDSNGEIVRFPGVPKSLFKEIEEEALSMVMA